MGMASKGRPLTSLPPAPPIPQWAGPWDVEQFQPAVDIDMDCSELSTINQMLNRCRARLFRSSEMLKVAQRQYAEAQVVYDRAMRRQMVSLSGRTEAARKAMAEILCEEHENAVIVARQVVEECKKRSLDARDDLKAVENLAHNARALMNLV